ncbi:hypothetical protein [Sporolactobacillus terrae]|nr:hypothetical protein [Sporolactobacillus terrae]
MNKDEVIKIFTELLEAWEDADKTAQFLNLSYIIGIKQEGI